MFKIFIFCLAFSLQLLATDNGPGDREQIRANLRTRIGLNLISYDTIISREPGTRVSFECYSGPSENRTVVWAGRLSFDGSVTAQLTNYWDRMDSEVHLVLCTEDLETYQRAFDGPLPRRTESDDRFTYTVETTDLQKNLRMIRHNIVEWDVPIALSPQDVIAAVNAQKLGPNHTGPFPEYKYTGYDWSNPVENCITFSCKVLRSLGVTLNHCTELESWLRPSTSGSFKKFWYRLTFGPARCYVDLKRVIREIKRNERSVQWVKDGHPSGPANVIMSKVNGLRIKL